MSLAAFNFILGMAVLVMLIVGIVLVVRGLKGRVVPTGPRCSECGFDLSGLPTPAGHEDTRCPECGKELCYPGRIVREQRVRRWRMAGVGAVLVLIGLGPELTS